MMEALSRVSELETVPLRREALEGPRVRVLNLGGFANPDVLHLELESGESVVVKDYAQRSLPMQLVAPLLIAHERGMISRLGDLPGIPGLGPRVDRLAFAMEFIDGEPLRLRTHRHSLPSSFFDQLEVLIGQLGERGVFYTDLRSPSNVLVTHSGSPALVDLSSAVKLGVPRGVASLFEQSALRKLRSRYQALDGHGASDPYEGPLDLHSGLRRIRVWDSGPLSDRVPIVFLPDAGLGAEFGADWVTAALSRSRRIVVLELPGFGGSRAPRLGTPTPRRVAAELARMLRMLRLPRVDLIARGWSGLVARWLAGTQPERVRALLTVESPDEWIEEPFLSRWRAACENPDHALRALRADVQHHSHRTVLSRCLDRVSVSALQRAYRAVPVRSAPRAGWETWRVMGMPEPLCAWTADESGGRPGPGGWRGQALRDLESLESLVDG